MVKRAWWFPHVVVGLALVLLTVARARHAAMDRPFEVDELLTVAYYSWVCVAGDGTVRQLDHIDEFYALPRPGVANLLMGVYCSGGRWPEPNNHIVNSLLIGGSLLWERSEQAARLPALAACAIFAFAMYWLCSTALGWRLAAPFAALWAWFSPPVVEFAFRARGYTIMLALQILFLLAMRWLSRQPASILRGTVCAVVAVLTFLNVVNTAVDWLAPAYLSLFLAPPPELGPADDSRRAWRRNLVTQALAVAGIGLTFLISHLPSVYASAQQYGLPFDSVGGFFAALGEGLEFVFAGIAGKMLGALSIAGFVLMMRSAQARWLWSLTLWTLAISLAHFLVTRKVPYERGLLYILPFALLGAAYLIEAAARVRDQVVIRGGAVAAAAAFTVALALPSLRIELVDRRLASSRTLANQLEPSSGVPTMMILDHGFDYLAAMYRPRTWQYTRRPSPGQDLQIVAFLPYDDLFGLNLRLRLGPNRAAIWNPENWQLRRYPIEGSIGMVQVMGDVRPFPDGGTGRYARALFFWFPDPARLGVRGDDQLRHADDSGLPYLIRSARYSAKLDIFTNIESLIFFAESPAHQLHAATTVASALQRFGGSALVFVPRAAHE